jgi:hypothetical protein
MMSGRHSSRRRIPRFTSHGMVQSVAFSQGALCRTPLARHELCGHSDCCPVRSIRRTFLRTILFLPPRRGSLE